MRAADLMTRHVFTVRPNDSVRDAARLLAGNGFTAVPVIDDDATLLGVVTEADVLRDRIPADPRSQLSATAVTRQACPETVEEVMTAPAMAVPAAMDVAALVKFMLRHRLRSVPIVEESRLIGIVTRRDLVRCVARSDAAIATDIRRRLEVYSGGDRWQVDVRRGRATIYDERDDPMDAHLAKIIALAVPGVEFVRVLSCPEDEPSIVPEQSGRTS